MRTYRNALGSEQITAWYPGGTPFDQWKASGKDIISVVDRGNFVINQGYAKWLYTNSLGWKAGDTVQITVNLTNNGGATPRIRINNKSYQSIWEKSLVPGVNTFTFVVPVDFLDRLYLYNQIQMAMNFSGKFSVAKVTPDAVVSTQSTQANPVQTVVSAATILKDEAAKGTIVTQSGKVIGAASVVPEVDIPAEPGTIMGMSKKNAIIGGIGLLIGVVLLRKIFKRGK